MYEQDYAVNKSKLRGLVEIEELSRVIQDKADSKEDAQALLQKARRTSHAAVPDTNAKPATVVPTGV